MIKPSPSVDLELLIELFRQLYISRTNEDHVAVPTIHQYALATKTLPTVSNEAQEARRTGLLSRSLYGIYDGLVSAAKSTSYFWRKATWSDLCGDIPFSMYR